MPIDIIEKSPIWPKMIPTEKGNGLIMTDRRRIFKFRCLSSDSCFFEKEDNVLKIERGGHILLSVPASLMLDC